MSDSYLGCFDYKKYGDPHRMFVQGMMTRGILEPDEFEHLFDLCLRHYKGINKVKQVIIYPKIKHKNMMMNVSNVSVYDKH